MRKMIRHLSVALALASFTGSVFAQEGSGPPPSPIPESTAPSLDDLLNEVLQGGASEGRRHQERLQQFRQRQAQQQQLLTQAENDKTAQERRSRQLEDTRRANETELQRLQSELDTAKGELRELFGVLQQVAGDTRGVIAGSLVTVQANAQGLDRAGPLENLIEKASQSSTLPNIDEISVLWQELQRELTESGKVTRFTAEVVSSGGIAEETDVIRVGDFMLTANGKYYIYEPTTGKIVELGKQPARFVGGAAKLAASSPSDYVSFGIDPTRGQLLQLLIQKPSLVDQWHQGGPVGYFISGLGLFAVLITIYKVIALSLTNAAVRSQMKRDEASTNNPLGRILSAYDNNRSVDVETLELKLDEAILKETPAIERLLTVIKIISAVAPLLGLLGTVTGMIETFQAITLFGTGDPKLMADGISTALVTTVLGLLVAIPTLVFHSFVAGIAKNIIHVLEEQAAGIIAVHAEKENG